MEPQIAIPEWQMLGDPGLDTLPFQDRVLDSPSINSRAGLYIYLNAILHDRPAFDDGSVLQFLNARYREDVPGLVSDLILAAFDILANATYRNEPLRSINIIRSFLVNKLPLFLLNNYVALIFEPLTIEQCIRQAFGRIDPSAFPSFSQMFDFSSSSGNSVLSEARQEFLFACALHQLIQEQSIEEILGDVPMQSLPAGGRYAKDDLVTQCTLDPSKIEQFVGELENLEGNAGEIASALIEIIHSLCANNETITLKNVCNTLSRKPIALDIIMLFTSPIKLLQPLCQILDNWQDHDDQGEYQPVYDEFGSILLLVAAVKARFNLTLVDLGLVEPDSYLRRYFRTSSISRPLDNLSERESEILGAWIKCLFEAEVISDELMSMCKPKEFHLLVTTLFDQSFKARLSGVLSFEKLKGGFDFLLEPFLLPSLIAALTWCGQRLYEANQQTARLDIMLPALEVLLKPTSISHESSAIHSAVLAVVARDLKAALSQVKKDHPSRTDVSTLIQILAPFHDDRPGHNALTELASWSATPHGGLQAALRNTLNALVTWSATSTSSTEVSPPSYSHAQVEEMVELLGARKLLDILVAETLAQDSASAHQEIVLDCAVVTIVATQHHQQPASQRRTPHVRLSLHDALQLAFHEANELSHTDPARATLIIRLQRRVDTLLGRKAEASVPVNNQFMTGVAQAGDTFAPTSIDDVIAEAENQTAEAQAFLSGENAALMGMA